MDNYWIYKFDFILCSHIFFYSIYLVFVIKLVHCSGSDKCWMRERILYGKRYESDLTPKEKRQREKEKNQGASGKTAADISVDLLQICVVDCCCCDCGDFGGSYYVSECKDEYSTLLQFLMRTARVKKVSISC